MTCLKPSSFVLVSDLPREAIPRFALLILVVVLMIAGCEQGAETRRRLSPANRANWRSRKSTEVSGATSYVFEGDCQPPLMLHNDGKNTLVSTKEVNAVLRWLKLPPVSGVRPDKGYAEDSRPQRGQYHWDDYPLGPLVIERGLATDKRSYKQYDSIWKVRIDQRR